MGAAMSEEIELERLQPPFRIGDNGDALFVEDAGGRRFGFTFYRERPLIGTDRSGRLPKVLASRVVRFIARQATAWAERPPG